MGAMQKSPYRWSMNEQPLLAVRGESLLEVDPEIAYLSVSVTARDPDRAKTLRLLNKRAKANDEILKRFGDAIEKIDTARVSVSPQLRSRKPEERISGYVGVVWRTITVVDFDRLGELVAQLANQDLTEVAGPTCTLRPASPVHRRARVDAVQDAVQRARDYAGAIGSRLTDLVELADVGQTSDVSPRGLMFAGAARASARPASAPDEFTFEMTPIKQVVRGTVEARFRISPPDLAVEEPDRN